MTDPVPGAVGTSTAAATTSFDDFYRHHVVDVHRSLTLTLGSADLAADATAEALGIAPGTVESRLHRALARLATDLGDGQDRPTENRPVDGRRRRARRQRRHGHRPRVGCRTGPVPARRHLGGDRRRHGRRCRRAVPTPSFAVLTSRDGSSWTEVRRFDADPTRDWRPSHAVLGDGVVLIEAWGPAGPEQHVVPIAP